MASRLSTPSVITSSEAELRAVMDDFVNVYESLDQSDVVDSKPNYSYTELIYLAILRSPNFCLPITEIYKYIKNRFSYFRSPVRKHWNNAVRHSLSKTKCFTKIAVGRGSSGQHNLNRSTYLWCIVPGSIVNFARGDYRPNVDTESGTNTLRWGYFRVNAGQFWEKVAVYLEMKMEMFKHMILTTQSPGKVLEDQACYMQGIPLPTAYNQGFIESIYNTPVQPTGTVHHGPHANSLNTNVAAPNIKSQAQGADTSTDSGNGSLLTSSVTMHDGSVSKNTKSLNNGLTSPEVQRVTKEDDSSKTYQGPSVSCLSVDAFVLEESRKTPELPDLGHVSPLTISPSLSPIGNISTCYEHDSGLGTSFTSNLQTAPSTTLASTPIVTSLPQQRFMFQPFPSSISPPIFPSISPSNLPLMDQTSLSGLPVHQKLSLPHIQSSLGSSSNGYQSAFTSRGSLSPPFYMPHHHQTGSYELLPYPVPFLSTPVSYHSDFMSHYPASHESSLTHYQRYESGSPYSDWVLS